MKKRCAVFTLAYNEKYFLPLWLKYYSQFGMENLYVLDHESTDGSTCNLECNVRLVEHDQLHDNKWMLQILKEEQRRLLKHYEYVIHPDADEFIIPDPDKHKNLSGYLDYMKKNSIDVIACKGYEVIHQRYREPALDWTKPILMTQRKFWANNDTYDKPIIGAQFINWIMGKHWASNRSIKRDDNLLLVHLHRVDFETCRQTLIRMLDAGKRYRGGRKYPEKYEFIIGDELTRSFDKPPHWNHPKHSPCILSEIPERFRDIV